VHDTIAERIDTVTKATQALTVACARCHDHKFDPIPTLITTRCTAFSPARWSRPAVRLSARRPTPPARRLRQAAFRARGEESGNLLQIAGKQGAISAARRRPICSSSPMTESQAKKPTGAHSPDQGTQVDQEVYAGIRYLGYNDR